MLHTKRIFVGALIAVLISTTAAVFLWNAVSTGNIRGNIRGLLARVLPDRRSEADDGRPDRPASPSSPSSPLSRFAGGRDPDNPSSRPERPGPFKPTSPPPVKLVDGGPSSPPNLPATWPPSELPATLEEGKEDRKFVDLSAEQYNRRSRALLEKETGGIQRILELAEKKDD